MSRFLLGQLLLTAWAASCEAVHTYTIISYSAVTNSEIWMVGTGLTKTSRAYTFTEQDSGNHMAIHGTSLQALTLTAYYVVDASSGMTTQTATCSAAEFPTCTFDADLLHTEVLFRLTGVDFVDEVATVSSDVFTVSDGVDIAKPTIMLNWDAPATTLSCIPASSAVTVSKAEFSIAVTGTCGEAIDKAAGKVRIGILAVKDLTLATHTKGITAKTGSDAAKTVTVTLGGNAEAKYFHFIDVDINDDLAADLTGEFTTTVTFDRSITELDDIAIAAEVKPYVFLGELLATGPTSAVGAVNGGVPGPPNKGTWAVAAAYKASAASRFASLLSLPVIGLLMASIQ